MKTRRVFERSLLLRLGAAMAIIALLGLAGMATSAVVAEATQGYARAINLSGALRMQGYRLATLATQTSRGRVGTEELAASMQRLDADLSGQAISRVLPRAPNAELQTAHEAVVANWQAGLRPLLERALAEGAPTSEAALLDATADFVAQVNELVGGLERAAETRITLLRTILGIALFLTLVVVFVTMYLVHTDVLLPLRDLLDTAASIGRGNLRARTQQTGGDELGLLGQTLNRMAEDLNRSYQELEERVRAKTADLERSNRSLELLYHSITRLYSGPVAPETYRILLRDIESVVGLGRGSACLIEQEAEHQARLLASTLNGERGDLDLCAVSQCAECLGSGETVKRPLPGGESMVLAMPLRDLERQYGVLQLEVPKGKALEPWQMQLLEALCKHIGIAIGTAHRVEQSRLLTVLEERAVIARELHDSLAQSLSYMKIQVSRLQGVLAKGQSADEVMEELRDGLNGAYRQLRELLTTFRLKLDRLGLGTALRKTADEFAERGGIPIELESHLVGVELPPNQEIHVLQIVREALANVIHHSHASRARVQVEAGADGVVTVSIEDDGVGIGSKANALHHYGMTIMEERTRSLGGSLQIRDRSLGGTRVLLRFPARRSASPLRVNPLPR